MSRGRGKIRLKKKEPGNSHENNSLFCSHFMAVFTFGMLLSPHQIIASLSEFPNITDSFHFILKQETEHKLCFDYHMIRFID
jgi:hypothetical protein